MQMDFKHQTGRRDDLGNELYSDNDLAFGIVYAEGWMEEGEQRDLIGDFDLSEFRDWCASQLRNFPTTT